MSLKLILCPVIGDGQTIDTSYRPKIMDYVHIETTAIIKSNPDGSPRFPWCLCLVRKSDWADVAGDVDIESVFGVDLPESIDDFQSLKAFLQSRTIGDIPAQRRQRSSDISAARRPMFPGA